MSDLAHDLANLDNIKSLKDKMFLHVDDTKIVAPIEKRETRNETIKIANSTPRMIRKSFLRPTSKSVSSGPCVTRRSRRVSLASKSLITVLVAKTLANKRRECRRMESVAMVAMACPFLARTLIDSFRIATKPENSMKPIALIFSITASTIAPELFHPKRRASNVLNMGGNSVISVFILQNYEIVLRLIIPAALST